ncbi:MAG: hypothetical protein FWC26_07245, partial [Fibromonadales bacterium]|nr:hypothetical protein [Fibromonadales bacterium]
TPITMLLWERYGLEGNAFTLNFNRLLLDSVVFSLGLASHSISKSNYFIYPDIVQQLYTGSLKRDSSRVPLGGRNLAYNSIHFVPAISWIFPHSSITVQASYLFLDNDDATRDFPLKNDLDYSITFSQKPYDIKGGADFYRLLWIYNFLPNWELSMSHRLAEADILENYTAQTGETTVLRKGFLNPYANVRYEYLRNKDSTLYQDRQLAMLGINDTLSRWFALRGQAGLQRNASAFEQVDFAPALSAGMTLFLPWHLQLNGDFQRDTRFPDMHETHIAGTGRITFPNADLKQEKRQRFEANIEYKLSEHFFYSAGLRHEEAKNSIMPFWAVPKLRTLDSLPADSAYMWFNAPLVINNEVFWRLGFELGNWRFYAEQGKAFLRTEKMYNIPSRYYKGAIYWSNRFVQERLKVSCQFDADWFGNRQDWGIGKPDGAENLEVDTLVIARPVQLRKYLSLNFKSAMQIQSFILYMRIENMNHSLMEPEIGYTPPGIRFAYGIAWELGD